MPEPTPSRPRSTTRTTGLGHAATGHRQGRRHHRSLRPRPHLRRHAETVTATTTPATHRDHHLRRIRHRTDRCRHLRRHRDRHRSELPGSATATSSSTRPPPPSALRSSPAPTTARPKPPPPRPRRKPRRSITYDGSPTAPTDAGTYAVTATVTDPNYQGAVTGSPRHRQSRRHRQADGARSKPTTATPKTVTATTDARYLAVTITYDGSPTPPTAAGTYAVAATITDTNYQGSATGSLVIAPGNDFASWRTSEFPAKPSKLAGLADETADPDADGWTNLR